MSLYNNGKYEEIDKYLASLNLSDADLAALQKLWLPDGWGKPTAEPIVIPNTGSFRDYTANRVFGENLPIVENYVEDKTKETTPKAGAGGLSASTTGLKVANEPKKPKTKDRILKA